MSVPVAKNDIISIKQYPWLWRVTRVDVETGDFDAEHFAEPKKLTAAQKFMLKMWGYDERRIRQLCEEVSA